MRRDIGFYIEANIEQVYKAYLNAAINEPFERECAEKPYHTISFGINFSFKYNMNGGSCNIHFMPSGTGTAVNMRFSIAQAVGARYEKYAEDLNEAMQAFLPVTPRPMEYDMDEFLKPANQVTPAALRQAAAPQAYAQAPAAPAVTYAPAPQAPIAAFCTKCGNRLSPGSRFCDQCGTPVAAPAQKVCPNCKSPVLGTSAFCSNCGTPL